MIIKFLNKASGSSFHGVDYNERKENNKKAQLLTEKNFDGLLGERNATTYKEYLKMYSSKNEFIKNPQLHVVVSGKGKMNSAEELQKVAEDFLKEMGYAKNPYLIYFHDDTKHNHVHIVSSRVNPDGKKIDDSFEYLKKEKWMKEYFGLDYDKSKNIAMDIASSYKYSNANQYKLILEKLGYGVKEDTGQLKLFKHGIHIDNIDLRKINERFHKSDQNRRKQIYSIINKYAGEFNQKDFQTFLKKKFGIDLVYHYGKDKTVPYGFSVIDHYGKNVYKGSEIMKMNILQGLHTAKGLDAQKWFELNYSTNLNYKELENMLKVAGGSVKGSHILLRGTFYDIPDDQLKRLLRNDFIEELKGYAIDQNIDKEFIKSLSDSLYGIKYSGKDLNFENIDDKIKAEYTSLLNAVYEKGGDLSGVLKSRNIDIYELSGNSYLVDKENKVMLNLDSLTGMNEKISFSQSVSLESIAANENNLKTSFNDFHEDPAGVGESISPLDFLSRFATLITAGSGEDEEQIDAQQKKNSNRKRKR